MYIGGSFPFARPTARVLGPLARLTRLERLRSDRLYANWLRSMGADMTGLEPEQVTTIVRTMRHDARTGEEHFTRLLEEDAEPLRAPIISVVGERDSQTEYYQERYKEWHLLTGSTALVVLDEGGHYFLRYRPAELAEIVTATHAALAAGKQESLEAQRRGPGAGWWLGGVSKASPPPRIPPPPLLARPRGSVSPSRLVFAPGGGRRARLRTEAGTPVGGADGVSCGWSMGSRRPRHHRWTPR